MSAYLENIIPNIPRIICQLNRNQTSPSYGCFDRDFWHYKITDFPCARKQEAALTLALLFVTKHEKNPYYGNNLIKSLSIAALEYWAKIQNANGSFNEWYPFENSFVATAFSTYAVTEALRVLSEHPSNSVLRAIYSSADYLCRVREVRAQNQQAGAIAAMYNCFLITRNETYRITARKRLAYLKKHQSSEGWFYEYGGPDTGYLSLCIDYLMKYHFASGDNDAKTMAMSATAFLSNFMHPDYTCGGVYGSRNTEYLIPSAFEGLVSNDAVSIAYFCEEGIRRKTLTNCSTLDDRYLLYNGYTYLQAHLQRKRSRLQMDNTFQYGINESFFKESGLYIKRTKHYTFIVNTKKGGAFYFYSNSRGSSVRDSGAFVLLKNGNISSSSFIGSTALVSSSSIRVSGRLKALHTGALTPFHNVLLRSFQILIGRNERIGRFVKERLRNLLITPRHGSSIVFERMFMINNKEIIVRDEIRGKQIMSILVGSKNHAQYVPSTAFFSEQELSGGLLRQLDDCQIIKKCERRLL